VTRSIKLVFLGVLILAGIEALALFFHQGEARVNAQANGTDVVVVNRPDMPIPTTDGRIPWQRWTIVELDNQNYRSEPVFTVPKGFRLFINDINFDGCSQTLVENLGSNLTIWPVGYTGDPNTPPDDHLVPKDALILTRRGVFRGMTHWGTSQQPNIFVNEEQAVWAEVYRSIGRGHAEARVWVSGFLVPMNGATPAPW
jgi:hypothetical protein